MSDLNIDVNSFGSLEALVSELGTTQHQVELATQRALNKTAEFLKSQTARKISEETQVQLSIIRKRLRIVKANRTRLSAILHASLHEVKAGHLGFTRQNSRGARAGKHQFAGSFVAQMPRGYTGIFKRKTSKSLPIQEMTIPLEPAAGNILKQEVEAQAYNIFEHYFRRELRYLQSIRIQ